MDAPKRKIKDNPLLNYGGSNPDIGVGTAPRAGGVGEPAASNSPQVSGISSSFVGGTITTQTVGKYVDQGNFMSKSNIKVVS